MGLLDLSKAKARTTKVVRRMKPYNYEDALSYLKYSHEAAMKKSNKAADHPWIVTDKEGSVTIEIDLRGMPLYWKHEPTGKKRTVYTPAAVENGEDPDTTKVEAFTYDEKKGYPQYAVASADEGLKLINALLEGKDDDFKAILTNAAEALKFVQENELPDITKQAEYWYNYKGYAKELGAWKAKDEGNKISKKKTNVMNSCKQTARRQLGYARAKDEVQQRV